MLTRLKVNGFKNLVDTEIRFGPFTCIAGFNGVGKSNIFDAIHFLALLADHTFADAARQIRGGQDPADLFTASGDGRMHFECDIVVPKDGRDEFNQNAHASHTYLTYNLSLELERSGDKARERIALRKESLQYVTYGEVTKRLGFAPSALWVASVIVKSPRRAGYIETTGDGVDSRIRLSADKTRDEGKSKRGGGRPTDFLAANLPRTVLSAASHADEARTAVLVRAEMRSWRVLQLEPSSLRVADDFHAPTSLTVEGKHLPATLYRLASRVGGDRVLAEVSNRLAELVDDVRDVRVERDDARRALQLVLTDTRGQEFTAASLSDGTLRFVALSVLEHDEQATGVFCLEEPENGIHPERVQAIMRLLVDMATDIQEPLSEGNRLRQVIISTHSPIVVAHAPAGDLLFADHRDRSVGDAGIRRALVLRPCTNTWRCKEGSPAPVGKGTILEYLGALVPRETDGYARSDTTYSTFGPQLKL